MNLRGSVVKTNLYKKELLMTKNWNWSMMMLMHLLLINKIIVKDDNTSADEHEESNTNDSREEQKGEGTVVYARIYGE